MRIHNDFEAAKKTHPSSKRQVEFHAVQSSPKKSKLFDQELETITNDQVSVPVEGKENLPGIIRDRQFCAGRANEDSFKVKSNAKRKAATKKQKKNILSPRQKVMTMFFKAP